MFYYKITGSVEKSSYVEKIANRHEGYEERTKCATISNELFERSDNKRFIFISSITKHVVNMGLVSSDNNKIESSIKSFIGKLEFKVSDIDFEEITFKLGNRMMKDAERSD